MGWYTWVPRMDCYHGLFSFSDSLQGTLTLKGKVMDFFGGRGYIEKDWGQSFPAAWVWLQNNYLLDLSFSTKDWKILNDFAVAFSFSAVAIF